MHVRALPAWAQKQADGCMVVKRQQCCMVVHIPPWLMVSRGSHCMANKFDTMQILQRGEKEEPAKWCCFLRLILLFFLHSLCGVYCLCKVKPSAHVSHTRVSPESQQYYHHFVCFPPKTIIFKHSNFWISFVTVTSI